MLTNKQIRFIDEYLIDSNATQAAIRAGYSVQTARVIGCENLIKPAIREVIEARQRVFAEKAGVSKENVLAGFLEALELAQKQCNPAAMIAGWRELGRMLGYYQPEEHKIELGADGA